MSRKRRNVFATVLFFLILALIFFVWSQQRDSIKGINSSAIESPVFNIPNNWPTYQNKEYGFELKTPPGWIEKSFRQMQDQYSFSIVSPDLATGKATAFEHQDLAIVVQIFEPSLSTNIENRTCKIYAGNKNDCITHPYIYVDGIKAVKRTYKVPDAGYTNISSRDIDFIKNNTLFHFYTAAYSYGESIQNLSTQTLVIDKIVSTFRFIYD
ncbi:MAG: hypothetical protein NTW17_00700 [Candidatus Pacearchaeota archaeon]|nr:hypothetical protein [Candidatus Pacearchaeota archaeon]